MKPLREQKNQLTPHNIPNLLDPGTFYAWVSSERSSGCTNRDLAARVAEIGGFVAAIRAAHLYGLARDHDRWLEFAGMGLMSDDPVVRGHALAHLARHEATLEVSNNDATLPRSAASLRALEEALKAIRQSTVRTPFSIEAEVQILLTQAEIHVEQRAYDRALDLASEAILASKWLNAPALHDAARLIYGLASIRSENLSDALTQYELVVNTAGAKSIQGRYASINSALIWLRLGDDELASKTLETTLAEHPNDPTAASSLQYVRAAVGLLCEDEPVLACPSGNYDVQVRAYQFLATNAGQPNAETLRAILEMFRDWQPNAATVLPNIEWFQGLAWLRLGQPLLAAQRVRHSSSKMPDVAVLLAGLKLEIALHFEGEDIVPVPQLCAELRELFAKAPSPKARVGLARRLTLRHPVAAAFVALSPFSIPEVADAAIQSVFKDGRSICVHGKGVPTRLPFVQATLEAFGLNARLTRDEHVERKRMRDALLIQRGDQWQLLPVVPPALIVYHLVRVAETNGHAWHRLALELARTHGLVPRTLGGHLRAEREHLQKTLEALLAGQIDTPTFRQNLSN